MLALRDPSGRLIGYLDGDVIRDDSGKVTATRTGKDADAIALADKAQAWMEGRSILLSSSDLSPLDVATAKTQAEYGIPALDCIADRVSPVEFIKNKAGVVYAENVADAVSPPDASMGDDAQPQRIDPGYTPATFTTVGFGLAAMIPRLVGANADFDLKSRATHRIVQGLRLLREARVATLLTTAGSYATANQIAATNKWDGGTNPAPLTNVFAALAASYLPANAIVLSENVAQYFYSQPTGDTANQVRDFVQAGGQLPTPIIARAKILSGGAIKYVWSTGATTNVPLVRVGMPDTIPTTRSFRWLGEAGTKDGTVRGGMLVREFTDRVSDTNFVVVSHDDIELIINTPTQVGALITGALA
jgi:hypothetical protein